MLDLKQYKYTGDTPKPVFNTTFYTGKDFYSDGDSEYNIIKQIA